MRPLQARSTAGFSLVELAIVVSIIGIVSLYAYPKVVNFYDQAMLRSARTALTNMYNLTRTAARTSNRVAVLRTTGNVIQVELNEFAPATTKEILIGVTNMRAHYGVNVAITGSDTLRVDPRGMLQTFGQTPTSKWVLSRNGKLDSVVINAYGRVLR